MAKSDTHNYDNWLRREFDTSLVAVAASAHALDALYGSTAIPDSIRAQRSKNRTKRHGKIREALKAVFITGAVNSTWTTEFRWLFELRDAAAHTEEKPKPTMPHPLGQHIAPEHVHYSTESADRATSFALSVITWCINNPRRNLAPTPCCGAQHIA